MYGFTINVDGNSIGRMKEIQDTLKQMGINAKIETAKVEHAFSGMGAKIKGVLNQYKSLIAGSLVAGGIWGGVEFVKSGIEAYEKLEKVLARVDTVVKSTKGAAGFSAKNIEDQAKELGKGIVAGRADIMDAQGMLLSFTGIKGPIIAQTTKAVADFATFYKTDMTSAALSIGKAMNDPVKGMTKLQKQGVTFTEEQKKQIKNYEQQGKLALAQGVILKELSTEFGGQAAAFALTDEGKMAMAKKSWGDMKIQLGETFSKIQVSLIPAFKTMVGYVKDAFNSAPVQFFLTHLKDVVALVVKAIPYYAAYKAITMSIALVEKMRGAGMATMTVIQRVQNFVTMGQTAATITLKTATEAAAIATASFGAASTEAKAAQLSLAAAEEASAVAASGFKAALISTGIGAFVIALGWVISKLKDANDEFQTSIDKITGLKQITQTTEGFQKQKEDLQPALQNFWKLSKSQQVDTYRKSQELLKAEMDQNATFNAGKIDITKNSIADLQKQYNNLPTRTMHGEQGSTWQEKDDSGGIGAKITELKAQLANATEKTKWNTSSIAANTEDGKKMLAYFKKNKIDPTKDYNPITGSAISDNAKNTSDLAGAKGGLGEAKIINIHIDTLQKNTLGSGKELVEHAKGAIEILTRTLNNMAYSQSSTM